MHPQIATKPHISTATKDLTPILYREGFTIVPTPDGKADLLHDGRWFACRSVRAAKWYAGVLWGLGKGSVRAS